MTKKRDIGLEILEGLEQIKLGQVKRYNVYAAADIKKARGKLDISQSIFAKLLGVSIKTLQAWEQGARKPSGAAASLLQIVFKRPDVVREVLVRA